MSGAEPKRDHRGIRRGLERGAVAAIALAAASVLAVPFLQAGAHQAAAEEAPPTDPLFFQTQAEADSKSEGCLSCHVGIEPMHASSAVKLGCTDCHGGDATSLRPDGSTQGTTGYDEAMNRAHVQPEFPEFWQDENGEYTSANPKRPYTDTLKESYEFIRFVNPGDLRVATQVCAGCHYEQVAAVRRSPMATSSTFWVAAGYANGIVGLKSAFMGEAYGRDGEAQAILQKRPPTEFEKQGGALQALVPLPRWETIQPGEYFRAFEDGGRLNLATFPEIGNPNPLELPGLPDIRLSERGRGTGLRISPALINIHKTRLNDPHLSFFGTNDHPGDYRSSGCSACHVVYANDRDPIHSGPWAKHGHVGQTDTGDQAICGERDASGACGNRDKGHPIKHQFTRAIPTSQCMSCHMHQPNSFVNTYLGYIMWDYETDGELMWPEEQKFPTEKERRESLDHNPEGAAVHGLWTDIDFLENVYDLNDRTEHTKFADYHGHGWIFRAVFKRDRAGNLLDADGSLVSFDDEERFDKAVHLRDIHAEGGMQCSDCHFSRDSHGDGLIKGEYGSAIEIECRDCHGTIDAYTDLRTTGPAAPAGGTNLALGTTPFGRRRFAWVPRKDGPGEMLVQRSMLDPDLEWEVKQVRDTVTPGHANYNQKSDYAKTITGEGSWGDPDIAPWTAAHDNDAMACNVCHSSWITSCSGCHLPQVANAKTEMNHYEGTVSKNYASYNPQVIRTDAYMLGIAGDTKWNKIMPVRSSSALILSSTNINRKTFYHQQAPISAPGFSSQAFNPHVPHTVRTNETKQCTDCHLSEANDNNAWMANLLTLGTNFPNFIGQYAWVAEGKKGLEAIRVTEFEEPQAVIGSYLHKIAFPEFFHEHEELDKELEERDFHHGGGNKGGPRSIQLRGEFLYTAKGEGGFEVFDVANIANLDFSERIVTGPVSPLGEKKAFKTAYATAVALPTNMPVAPWREYRPENREQPMHPIYHYAFISDREEGLILTNVDTLTDANPRNNFLERALTFNPNGELSGSENLTVAGNYVYMVGSYGLKVVDCSVPLEPRIVAHVPDVGEGNSVTVMFRYAFVTNPTGMVTVDVTFPDRPRVAGQIGGFDEVHNVYVARTYAYLAAGPQGMAIVDVTNPERPSLVETWNADGFLRDTRDVKVASTNASLFAYIADGDHGFAVAQLTSPETVPGYLGFSPRPHPELIAHTHTHGPALAVSKGLDRDRAVDESGNQVSIFNRVGSRPFNLEEMQRLYLKDGKIYTVTDEPQRDKRVTVEVSPTAAGGGR
jgi:hypothetical protein